MLSVKWVWVVMVPANGEKNWLPQAAKRPQRRTSRCQVILGLDRGTLISTSNLAGAKVQAILLGRRPLHCDLQLLFALRVGPRYSD
jgi:hypothetical protein